MESEKVKEIKKKQDKQIELVNDIIFNAILHGADPGGSYDCNYEGLVRSIEKWLNFNNIEGYVVEYVCRQDSGLNQWCVLQIVKGEKDKECLNAKNSEH